MMPRRRRNPETGGTDGEHAVIIGITRYGKTFLAKEMARYHKDVVVYDPKNMWHVPRENEEGFGVARVSHVDELKELDPLQWPYQIYSPDRIERKDQAAKERLGEYVYERGDTFFIIDELSAIAAPYETPDSIEDCYARGAERNICVVGLTQEPVKVDSKAFSQSQHIYSFYIAIEAHKKKVEGIMPIRREQIETLKPQQFFWWRVDLPRAIGPCHLEGGSDRVTLLANPYGPPIASQEGAKAS